MTRERKIYETKRGESFVVADLSARERRFLAEAEERVAANVDWPAFQNWYMDPGSPIHFVDGDPAKGTRTGPQKATSPVYRIVSDMGYELAIRQGYMAPSGRGGYRPGAGRPKKAEAEKREQLAVSIPPSVAGQLRNQATLEGKSVSRVVEEAVERGLSRGERSSGGRAPMSDIIQIPRVLLPVWRMTQDARPKLTYTGTTIGYDEVYGTTPTWEQVVERLSRYSLRQILQVLTRITSALYGSRSLDIQNQKRLCDGIFAAESEKVWAKAMEIHGEASTKHSPNYLSMFNHIQLITLAKVAFLHRPIGDKAEHETLHELGEALLMVNSLVDQNPGKGTEPGSTEYEANWLLYLVSNQLFNRGYVVMSALARAYDMYLTDRPHIRATKTGVDLPAIIKEVTGVTPDELWPVHFALFGHWLNVDLDQLATKPAHLNKDRYFSEFKFSDKQKEEFFSCIAIKAEDLQKCIAETYSLDDIKTYHVLPFAKWPLIDLGGDLFCVSSELLFDKITDGFYHSLVDPDKITDVKRRKGIKDYIGYVFEDYVEALLRRIYPESTLDPRYIRMEQYQGLVSTKKAKQPLCDIAIIGADNVVLIEQKAAFLQLEARSGLNAGKLLEYFDSTIYHAAAQISNTIDLIESGKFTHIGLDPKFIKRYTPLFLTLEHSIASEVIMKRITRDTKKQGKLQQAKTAPLQLMDVGELELVELAIASGRTFGDVVNRPTKEQALSFRNYWVMGNESFLESKNAYLDGLFKQMTEDALKFFESHHISLSYQQAA